MRCAVEKDLAEYEARMDREAAFEAACETTEEELYSDFVCGERTAHEDQELEERIGECVDIDDLIQAVMSNDSEARDRLVGFIRSHIETRCKELAPQIVKARAEDDEP